MHERNKFLARANTADGGAFLIVTLLLVHSKTSLCQCIAKYRGGASTWIVVHSSRSADGTRRKPHTNTKVRRNPPWPNILYNHDHIEYPLPDILSNQS